MCETETIKIDFSKYQKCEEDNCLKRFVDLNYAIISRYIVGEEMKVTLAPSNWARVRSWALGLKVHDPYTFGSLQFFEKLLRRMFRPLQDEFRDLPDPTNL